MATTTNYSWTTPDDTSLVKDGAAAIRTLGSSIDTTTKNLNPQTTTGAIAYRSATSNVNTSLPLGTAGQVLTVNSGATAPEWAAAPTGGMTLLASGSLSGTSLALSSISAAYKQLTLYIAAADIDFNTTLRIRFNNNSNSVYTYLCTTTNGSATSNNVGATTAINVQGRATTKLAGGDVNLMLNIPNYAVSQPIHICEFVAGYYNNSNEYDLQNSVGMFYPSTATAIDRIDFLTGGADIFTAGTYALYGVK